MALARLFLVGVVGVVLCALLIPPLCPLQGVLAYPPGGLAEALAYTVLGALAGLALSACLVYTIAIRALEEEARVTEVVGWALLVLGTAEALALAPAALTAVYNPFLYTLAAPWLLAARAVARIIAAVAAVALAVQRLYGYRWWSQALAHAAKAVAAAAVARLLVELVLAPFAPPLYVCTLGENPGVAWVAVSPASLGATWAYIVTLYYMVSRR